MSEDDDDHHERSKEAVPIRIVDIDEYLGRVPRRLSELARKLQEALEKAWRRGLH